MNDSEQRRPESATRRVVLCDAAGRAQGTAEILAAHRGEGQLHLAFSVYVFGPDRRALLIQQRSRHKLLWPLVWASDSFISTIAFVVFVEYNHFERLSTQHRSNAVSTLMPNSIEPVTPSEKDTALAKESSRQLAPLLGARKELTLQVLKDGHPSEPVRVPGAAVRLLVSILTEMAKGNAITLIPIHAELSTQEAADLLNVSRPFLVKLLDEGKIPSRKVGTHRRVLFSELTEYKKRSDQQRMKAVEALAAEAQELKLGY